MDTTNLHTHGLHVSPDEDDILLKVNPGERHTYTYNLPADHLMGTHWYHAHTHGSTALHVLGGLAGALLVEAGEGYELPESLEALYSADHLLVMTHVTYGEEDDGFALSNYPTLVESFPANETVTVPADTAWDAGVVDPDVFLINGQLSADILTPPGEAVLLRMVHATGIRSSSLTLNPPEGVSCSMVLYARDGVFQMGTRRT
mmetsp:Transcript_9085/g.30976  ORF Transcript_9085/g.30976 Transcript_9085/m.30976 type:complete len:203 (-) Transcript_9085:1755-2363(-)